MSRISETFAFAELENGIFSPEEDVIVEDSLSITPLGTKYKLIDLDEDRTERLGSPCFKCIYFEEAFDDDVTILYETYDSSRNDLNADRLKLGDNLLSFKKMINKSSVVEDGSREVLDFLMVTDVEPLNARYITLQQFSGKRLVSLYVIARALDDYFKNYYTEIDSSLASGYVETKVPWLRMNVSTGDRLEVKDGTLTKVASSEMSTLYPVDQLLFDVVDRISSEVGGLVSNERMRELVDYINNNYGAGKWNSEVVRGKNFNVVDNKLKFVIDGLEREIDWRDESIRLLGVAEKLSKEISELAGLNSATDSHTSIERLLSATLTNDGSELSYLFDDRNGNSITKGGKTIQYLGEIDAERVQAEVDKYEHLIIIDMDRAMVDSARKIAKVHVSRRYVPENKSAKTIEEMLDYLD